MEFTRLLADVLCRAHVVVLDSHEPATQRGPRLRSLVGTDGRAPKRSDSEPAANTHAIRGMSRDRRTQQTEGRQVEYSKPEQTNGLYWVDAKPGILRMLPSCKSLIAAWEKRFHERHVHRDRDMRTNVHEDVDPSVSASQPAS